MISGLNPPRAVGNSSAYWTLQPSQWDSSAENGLNSVRNTTKQLVIFDRNAEYPMNGNSGRTIETWAQLHCLQQGLVCLGFLNGPHAKYRYGLAQNDSPAVSGSIATLFFWLCPNIGQQYGKKSVCPKSNCPHKKMFLFESKPDGCSANEPRPALRALSRIREGTQC